MPELRRGLGFYIMPADLTPEQIDPLIRKAVFRINESGWCWTAESCQGHPESTDPLLWASNTMPMLRLVTACSDAGRMMAALSHCRADSNLVCSDALSRGANAAGGFFIC